MSEPTKGDLLLHAAKVTLILALPMGALWILWLRAFEGRPMVLRWGGVGIYGLALVTALILGRRLRIR